MNYTITGGTITTPFFNKKDFKVGYAVAEYYKNGRFKCFWNVAREHPDYEVEGVYGVGDMYYTKSHCKKDVDELNDKWEEEVFRCVKVKMEIIE